MRVAGKVMSLFVGVSALTAVVLFVRWRDDAGTRGRQSAGILHPPGERPAAPLDSDWCVDG